MSPHACIHIEQYRCGTGHTRRQPGIPKADHISTNRSSSDERRAQLARRQMAGISSAHRYSTIRQLTDSAGAGAMLRPRPVGPRPDVLNAGPMTVQREETWGTPTTLAWTRTNFRPLTPLSLVARTAAVYPHLTSALYEGRSFTWAETYDRCRRLACSLVALASSAGPHLISNEDFTALTADVTKPCTSRTRRVSWVSGWDVIQ